MNTNRRRVSRLLADLEAAGVHLTTDGLTIRVEGADDWPWLPGWIERNKPDLIPLLRRPQRHRPQNPA
ncbi:hypothetical protein G4Y73_06360 [Wenzhouxiangella sp. XN201]|uniref:hypothetical protein n=1 Tax=Wenzhouxiangella sp. XN201 TaxID=2710755 RepID=UPI0013CCF0FE|nr:hypothetical protein [Wenzhouxiangella sp. XN201]NEZ03771.1 hypothetical protein [Wenzhouxiangella sp. XN201]